MAHKSELIETNIEKYLKEHENKDILRFITCGSVDDGKSTLIGRLLYDSKMIFEDQLSSIKQDSKKVGTTDRELDLALLVDGLASEREQGITIDVAYRFFSTEQKKFIIADTPGHEQYTRNMVTGASNAELAVILIDARKGVLTQTKRHSYIVSLLGIREIIVAINKMDLVDFSEVRFNEIKQNYEKIISELPNNQNINFRYIPISALDGDNIVSISKKTPWYSEQPIMEILNYVNIKQNLDKNFRLPVQYVNRPHLNFRGYSGTIVSGEVQIGDEVVVFPSNKSSRVKSIVSTEIKNLMPRKQNEEIETIEKAFSPMAVTITLEDEIDISRGAIISKKDAIPTTSNSVKAMLVWFSEEKMQLNNNYLIKITTSTINGKFSSIFYKKDINNFDKLDANELNLNDIAEVNLELDQEIAFDLYSQNRHTGSFIVIDKYTNNTVGAGMITKNSKINKNNISWFPTEINKQNRAELLNQKPVVLWLTGLSASGKSTLANALEKELFLRNKITYLLDGDNIRHGLNRDLGFSEEDRIENIRRIGEASKLFVDAGLIVITAFISPFKSDRKIVKNLFEEDEFIEIFINTPIEVCQKRDPKGLYKKALNGEIKNFTGIDSPYEAPENPNIEIKTAELSITESVEKIVNYLKQKEIIKN
jgi:bifunctional enzyme CysN/CysC